MSDQRADATERPSYDPPKLTRHGKLAEVTLSTTALPDAMDSTMRPGERRAGSA